MGIRWRSRWFTPDSAGCRSPRLAAPEQAREPQGLTARLRERHTRRMSSLREMGGDVENALERVGVPSYVIDRHGIIRWVNPAARRLVGDVRGRQFTSVVSAEETRRAKEAFARKISGIEKQSDHEVVLVGADGDRVAVEISSVSLYSGDRIVGVFGQVVDVEENDPPLMHPHLTPRQ